MSKELELSSFLATAAPPELGPGPRAGVRADSELNSALDSWFEQSKLSLERQQLIRALLLLWHDHPGPAHELAQSIENADGAFVHGILHRREPDYGNAAYWFRRVGAHPAFPEIVKRVGAVAESDSKPELQRQLIRKGEWDPFAFIDACRSVANKSASDASQHYLRAVQCIETKALLDWFGQSQ